MPLGPGKYDKELCEALAKAKAKEGILLVIGGEKGQGFSCKIATEKLIAIPGILRSLANSIEADYKRGKI